MSLKHTLLDDESDFLNLEIEILPRNENDEISNYIIELLKTHIVLHWREIAKLVREKYTVSVERLQNILRDLVYSERIVELPCRFFTLSHVIERESLQDIISIVEMKVQRLNLSRCSPPLASSKYPIRFRISRSNGKEHRLMLMANPNFLSSETI
ncbi:MAG TPA: hypothetical protein EYP48_00095 [Ignisphaera sp.]|uniref:Uncharacterized protein n=1 Tax=Ignisphaera aggregans TaxID=334771 RepID=A0A832YYJ7_9CREN|nr:hypothetical protein [Ignisphaera sp.]HIP57179.1 hypothetical protein [Ignisphaera aggregans]